MGVNASRSRYPLDVAPEVTLRNGSDTAEAVTATETAISLKELDSAYWHDGEIPHGVIAVQIDVTELDVAGTNSYVLSLLVDDTSDLSDSPKTVSTLTITAAGAYTMFVDSKLIAAIDTESTGADKWMAIRATLAGDSTPSIKYAAWLAKSVDA